MKKPIPFGKYYLLEQVNVGGMAEVFKAKAYGVEGFERLIALKRILPNIAEDKEFIEMFIFEAKIAVQLNHANIAQIYELGKVNDAYFIALEYVHGKDARALFDRCRSKGESMPIAQACFIIMKMCEGLDYAHNKRDGSGRDMNLVHRDVSPQNVLVSFEGEVKLIDFGIAKAANKASKTQAGILKGKFGYMSPEQVRGLPVDRRSDVFASGIVLYELLTGERLFVGESDFSTLEKVRNVEILPPSTYNRKIPDELERIVLKALAKDVEDRYQNAIDLHDDLQAFVYTAGEFYARKDLAAWMKKGFAKEIEEEAAKLEQYRHIQLPAPGVTPPPQAQTPGPRTTLPPGSKRPTMSMPAAAPPPPPAAALSAAPRMSGRMGAVTPPPLPSGGVNATPGMMPKATLAMPAVQPPPEPRLAHAHGAHGSEAPERLEWDDEELETQIYGSPEEEAAAKAAKAAKLANGSKVNGHGAPSLGSLAPQGDAGKPNPNLMETQAPSLPPPPMLPGLGAAAGPNARTMTGNAFDPAALKPQLPPRKLDESAPWGRFDNKDKSGPTATATAVPGRSSRKPLILGISAGVVIVGGVIAVLLLRNNNSSDGAGGSGSGAGSGTLAAGATGPGAGAGPASGSPGPSASASPGAAPGVSPGATGATEAQVKVITDPAKLQAKLDGTAIGETPMNISRLTPGKHTLELFGSPLFAPKTEVFEVAAGESKELNLSLDALTIKAEVTTTPSGAKLFLEHDGARDALGESPQTLTLDPRKSYVLTAERDGYDPASQPVDILQPNFTVALTLVKSPRGGNAVAARTPPKGDRVKTPPVNKGDKTPPVDKGDKTPPVDKGDKTPPVNKGDKTPPVDNPPADKGGTGTLSINSKPWTTIFVDGREVGHTPKTDIQLKAGPHKITLVNNDLNIRAQLSVSIKAGEVTKVFKDLRTTEEPAP